MTPKEKALDIIQYRAMISRGNLERAEEQFKDYSAKKMSEVYELKTGRTPNDILRDKALELASVQAAYDYVLGGEQ